MILSEAIKPSTDSLPWRFFEKVIAFVGWMGNRSTGCKNFLSTVGGEFYDDEGSHLSKAHSSHHSTIKLSCNQLTWKSSGFSTFNVCLNFSGAPVIIGWWFEVGGMVGGGHFNIVRSSFFTHTTKTMKYSRRTPTNLNTACRRCESSFLDHPVYSPLTSQAGSEICNPRRPDAGEIVFVLFYFFIISLKT